MESTASSRDVVGRPRLVREVEDGDHHLHRVVRGLVDGLDVLAVDREVDAPRLPVRGVDVVLADVDRHPRRVPLLGQRRIAERVHAHADRAVAVRRRTPRRCRSRRSARARPRGPTIQTAAIERGLMSIRARTSSDAVVRRPAPVGRLELAHQRAVVDRLLADRAADRAREHPGLDARDLQRVVLAGAPEPLLGRDRQPQLGTRDRVRRGALRARAPLRQVVRDPDLGVEAGPSKSSAKRIGGILPTSTDDDVHSALSGSSGRRRAPLVAADAARLLADAVGGDELGIDAEALAIALVLGQAGEAGRGRTRCRWRPPTAGSTPWCVPPWRSTSAIHACAKRSNASIWAGSSS